MPDNDFFLVFGGHCEVKDGTLIIKQSIFRHMHPFVWFFSIVFISLGFYSYITGWIYTGGAPLEWKGLLFFGLYSPVLTVLKILFDRIRGFTGNKEISIESIRDISVKKEKRVWYLKERKIVPSFIVEYEKNGKTKRRRIRLNVRYHEDEFENGRMIFERLGFKI